MIKSLESGKLTESTIKLMVTMLPIVMATLLVFLFVIILLCFVVFRNERLLIQCIRKLETESGDGKEKSKNNHF